MSESSSEQSKADPTIFISYNPDLEATHQKVRELSTRLRSLGFAVSRRFGKHTQQIQSADELRDAIGSADHILVICTEAHQRTLASEAPEDADPLTVLEWQLIAKSPAAREKLIPVLLESEGARFVPKMLDDRRCYNISSKSDFAELHKLLTPCRVLFVDDDSPVTEYYHRAFEHFGIWLTHCNGPDTALETLRQKSADYSAVILDVVMPPGNAYTLEEANSGLTTGILLLKDVRRLYPHLPVVILSQVSDSAILELAPEEQPALVVHKYDCTPHQLVDAIEELLGREYGRRSVCTEPRSNLLTGESSPATPTPAHSTVSECAKLTEQLGAIPRGANDASRFHHCIFQILSLVFSDMLGVGKMVAEINDGRKRVDIIFRNTAETGFFADLMKRHEIKCPFIFFECKNYTDEPSNPEFDQLTGRFSDKRGHFGIVVLRKISNRRKLLLRCKDIASDNRGYVIVLDDDHILRLLQLRGEGNKAGISDFLDGLFEEIIL